MVDRLRFLGLEFKYQHKNDMLQDKIELDQITYYHTFMTAKENRRTGKFELHILGELVYTLKLGDVIATDKNLDWYIVQNIGATNEYVVRLKINGR